MRLIDEKALIEEAKTGGWDTDINELKMILKYVPTIDAVPVVRCGECANAKLIDKNESVYTCTHPQWTRRSHNDTFEESQLFHGLDGNDFCSYGAKMEEHNETD